MPFSRSTHVLAALTVTAGLAALPAAAHVRVRSRPVVLQQVRLQAQNEFAGLGWEVAVWRDGQGFHRATTVTDLESQKSIREATLISASEAQWLFNQLKTLRWWEGPKRSDWGVKDSDAGTVLLGRDGKQQKFDFYEYWPVADTIDKFGQGSRLRAAARAKGMGRQG